MKNLLFVFFMCLLVTACSTNDEPIDIENPPGTETPSEGTNPPGEEENPDNDAPIHLKINTPEETGNIFELMEFNVYAGETFSVADLKQFYDSCVWKVEQLSGRLKVLYSAENGSTTTNFKFKWGHNFFLPGEYQTVLLNYKNDEVITSDTITVHISDNKDFLHYQWKDITTSSTHNEGYADVLSEEYTFTTYYTVKDEAPSITLFIRNHVNEEESIFAEKSEKILLNYINSLYSNPLYDIGRNDLLQEKYKELFKFRPDNSDPLYIWITPKSRIVLFKQYMEEENFYKYKIQAEPNR